MGLGIGLSKCGCNCDNIKTTGNPDPKNFEIIKIHATVNYIIALIKYPNCTNYEGKKILVFTGITPSDFKRLSFIDPHFCDDGNHLSPVARFEPTARGWDMATRFFNSI